MNGEQYVIVYWDQREKSYRLTPSELVGHQQEQVTFVNKTDVTVTVDFHKMSPFDVTAFQIQPGTEVVMTVAKDASDTFPYEVLAHTSPKVTSVEWIKPIIIILD